MELDVRKLSDREIGELIRSLTRESSRRGEKNKKNAKIETRLEKMGLKDKLKSEGLTGIGEASEVLEEIQRCIYKMCDYSLGNYEVKECRTSKYKKGGKKAYCNTSALYDGMYDEYMTMCNELLDIFEKHFKGRR